MNILSLGAGVQSSVVALMAESGELGIKIDHAIFADTGWEPPEVMEYLSWLETQLSFPVHRVQHRNIYKDLLAFGAGFGKKDPYIPLFLEGGGPGKRQCTADYKIVPIQKKVRELLGAKPRERLPNGSVNMLIGISLDEIGRCKPSRQKWIWNAWPLIDRRMTRQSCLDWAADHALPEPPKSSCIGCPYHSEQMWVDMKRNHPRLFEQACVVDELFRIADGREKKQYMLRQCVPLRTAVFKPKKNEANQFNNECEGLCGV